MRRRAAIGQSIAVMLCATLLLGGFAAPAYAARKTVSIRLDAHGGKASQRVVKRESGKRIGALPKAARTGYRFEGWYTKKSGGSKYSKNAKAKVSMTLHAHWNANVYTVSFDENTGSVTTKSKRVTYGKSYGTLPGGTKPEYMLAGWYTAPVGGTKVTSASTVKSVKNTVLYAHWILKPLVSLYGMDYFTKSGDWGRSNSFIDNEGNPHLGWGIDFDNNSFGMWARTGDNIVFLLDSKYKTISGSICLLHEHRDTKAQIRIRAYRDNVLVYTSPVLTQGVRPLRFSLPLENSEQLKFEVEALTRDRLEFGVDATLTQL